MTQPPQHEPWRPQQYGNPVGPPPSSPPPSLTPPPSITPPPSAAPPQRPPLGGQDAPGAFGQPRYEYQPQPFGQESFGQEPASAPQKKSKKALAAALITGGSVAVLAIPLGILIGWWMQSNQYFEQAAVESQVEQVLGNDYGLAEVSEVTCPAEVKPEQGATFECTYVLNGESQSVPVTVGSEDGQLLIGSPVEEE